MKFDKLNFILVIVCFLSINLHAQQQSSDPAKTEEKLRYFFSLLRNNYVENIDEAKLTEVAIKKVLEELDPHSAYYTEEEIKKADEPLQGSFEGIGVQFQILRDTINIVEVIAGGPSEQVGIRPGDKIVSIDGENATGKKINNEYVLKKLRGPKGTKVNVQIVRAREKNILEFTIIRDKIPIFSVEASFLIDNRIGYIKVSRFAQKTVQELTDAFKNFPKVPSSLIIDLRDNSGGLLKTAIDMADLFLEKGKLIVYTEGKSEKRQNYTAANLSLFEKGKLIILIDEESASASEIVAGSLQDWDRALIVGRRSFGKGLVQRPYTLPDHSAIRLTVARYYTPSGRCIQKPYKDGTEKYYKELSERLKHGELIHPDSIKFPDSLRYKTNKGRIVYGGGGIMPDIFVPLDTTKYSSYYSQLMRNNVFASFSLDFLENKRDSLKKIYPTSSDFVQRFKTTETFMQTFFNYAEPIVKFNEEEYKKSEKIIQTVLKAFLARNLYGINSYYECIYEIDDILLKAVELLKTPGIFEKYGIDY
ncbi:MAG: S41 family peptidase [Bacteroidales bacterium]|nr:S41 family peptidase [Bacteroidales bacterium]